MAGSISFSSCVNSVLGAVAEYRYGQQVELVSVEQPPLFVLGHWRSGTTFLHQLLSHDAGLASPTTYECFVPNHFLLTDTWLPRMLHYLLPKRRPMDNVRLGWNEPQEDEFALCALGLPSPYLRMAFPNHGPVFMEYLDMEQISPDDLARWDAAMVTFLKRLTLRHGKQIVFKSPTHTGRLGHLAQLFPGAKFIHLVRHPFDLFPSTLRLWRSLDEVQGLQVSKQHDRLAEYVFSCLERMYDGFWRQRQQIADDRIFDVRYEDLVADPLGELASIYDHLGLPRFDDVRQNLTPFIESSGKYHRNRHELDEEQQRTITQRWSRYFETYRYSPAEYDSMQSPSDRVPS